MTAVSEGDVGRVLNQRYRLSRSLGRGGMGEVWLAVDTALGREVAVKELLLPASLDEAAQRSWLERSKREATAAARIRHENVVTVHDVFEEDGRPWIVMELVISRSLSEVVRTEGRLEYAEAARIGLDVLRALRAAHAKGVLHRDVKPANVLLGFDGRVVLTDFGIATFVDAPQVTHVGELLGTPGYLAPERAERFATGGVPVEGRRGGAVCEADECDPEACDADGREAGAETAVAGGGVRTSDETLGMSGTTLLDPASDLWSLGATLYEMVEGRPPFIRASPVEVVDAVVNHAPAPPRHAGALEPVVMGLLRKDPAERLDAKEAEELLVRVIQDALPRTWGGEMLPAQRPPSAGETAGPGAYRAGLGSGHTATHRSVPGGSGTRAGEAAAELGVHAADEPVEPTWAGELPDDAEAAVVLGGPAGDAPDPAPGRWTRRRKLQVIVPAVLALVLVATSLVLLKAVGSDGKGSDRLAQLRARSATYQAMVQRGYMIVGVKPDQPGVSQKGADGQYTGFDDDIARMIAADLGFAGKIRFVDVETQGREYRIASGQVDLVVASYTINPERLQRVSFAGPYYVAGQDFLVRKDDPGAARPEDLAGSRVCVVRESTSAARVRQKFPTMQVEERGKYSECVDELLKRNVRGVSTDDTILAGFVARHPAELRVLGSPFSDEPYGVGLSRGDAALAGAVCDALNRHIANGDWQRAYDGTLGTLGLLPPRPPKCVPHVPSE
ncbi:bifunctional serine/threonine-protein kinase/glutamate ABC transporter substrate-binding protein [Yinghuangia soli]|uniref:non-specific serine/threonine protein kinase n=1 Tax=Yinghuangia soli TaxID=2908204 RepID=A0AA41U6J8_9ACTN|nr:bifunctional serine/threonine-protein kinase/glutamate ABC transporter substrate-binding protein [Yinghuangia soli]MCF2533072.1 transporter substrate-binding domain-containing protein [Yinghuangia soli]